MRRIALISLALLAFAAAPTAASTTHTLTFKSRPWHQVKMTGDPAAAPVMGDMFAYEKSALFNLAGKRIGSGAATSTAVGMSSSTMSVLLSSVFSFPSGQLLSSGLQENTIGTNPLANAVTFTRAITGGTGRFAGARGVDEIVVKNGWVRHTISYTTINEL
ncbi:MAG: hypothetical protein ACR2J9_09370 [Gaiellales bacterium]